MESGGYSLNLSPIDPILLSPGTRASTSEPAPWEHTMTIDQDTIQTIQAATHIQLIEHNRDHQGLYANYMALKGKYERLSASYAQLSESLKDALRKPQQQSSTSLQSTSESSTSRQIPALPKPSQSDYPGIKFWTHHQYTQWKKNKSDKSNIVNPASAESAGHRRRGSAHLALTGENVQMEYIEEEDGTIVDGSRAASIRDLARRLLAQMKKDGNELPGKWQQADLYQKGYVLQALYNDYSYLSLCENHWKANLVISHVLSGEVAKGKKKLKDSAAKTERVEAGPSGSKRSPSPSSPVDQQTPKRVKMYTISPCRSPQQTLEEPFAPILPTGVTNPSENLDPVTSAGPVAEAATTPTRPSQEVLPSDGASPAFAAEPLVLVNPLTAVFGPERVPSTRMDDLQTKTDKKHDKKNDKKNNKKNEKGKKMGGRKKDIKENALPTNEGPSEGPSNDGSTLPDAAAASTALAPSPPLKRVTASKSAKNLFYIDYLSTHEPLTIEAFEALWKTLSKDEVKKWADVGKASRYVLEPVDNDEVNTE